MYDYDTTVGSLCATLAGLAFGKKGTGGEHSDALELSESKQVTVAGDNGSGCHSDGEGDNVVVVRVAADGADIGQVTGKHRP